ncbi:MAG: hypothetical protein CMF62_07985 [Magnetococcales bacterium]|nr:hypothetical protein [Magnetococcales bacterium]|tara:strand:- start:619874 stop:620284 length:411 start_codon:yes stop_codon:yes gene_type:complete
MTDQTNGPNGPNTPTLADNVSVKIDEITGDLPAEITSWIMGANSMRKVPDERPYYELTCQVNHDEPFSLYAIPTDEDLDTVHVIDAMAFVYPSKKMYFTKGYPIREDGIWAIMLCFIDKATNTAIKFKLRITYANA